MATLEIQACEGCENEMDWINLVWVRTNDQIMWMWQ
jgi:hypothetical protein